MVKCLNIGRSLMKMWICLMIVLAACDTSACDHLLTASNLFSWINLIMSSFKSHFGLGVWNRERWNSAAVVFLCKIQLFTKETFARLYKEWIISVMAKLKFQQSLVSPLLKKMGYQCWKCLSEMPFFQDSLSSRKFKRTARDGNLS